MKPQKFLKLTALFISISVTGSATQANAAAPMVKTSAPGYYRMMLGDFEVTALSDGTFKAPVNTLMKNISSHEVDKALARDFLSNPIDMSINAYLINTGEKLILIDSGLGAFEEYGPGANHLIKNLQDAGYSPDQIDEIYITHMHVDHVGGLVSNGKAAFPNAIVRADKREAEEWLGQTNINKAPENLKFIYVNDTASLLPYVNSQRFIPFDGSSQLAPGISTVSAFGHTPGHTMYSVESKGEKLLLLGDSLHLPAVQFANPAVTIVYDTNNKSAAVQRQLMFEDATAKGYLIAGSHISFPGLGHIRKAAKGFEWVPVAYKPMY